MLATKDSVGKRELDLEVVELLDCWLQSPPSSLPGLSGHRHSASPHVSVALGDGAWGGQVLVLPVHVEGATAGLESYHSQMPKFFTRRVISLKISSSSLAETQSTRSRTWQRHG